MRRLWVFSFLLFFPCLPFAAISLQDQQTAKNKIVELNVQKQQKQNQISNNNAQIAQNNGKMIAIALSLAALGFGNLSSTGIPTNIEASLQLIELKDELSRLKKSNKNLEEQNQNLQSEVQSLDSQITQQTAIISTPTQGDLQQQLSDTNQYIKNHEDYINWLKNKNQPEKDINGALWILQNERRRRDQILEQLQGGRYREIEPPSQPVTPQNLPPQKPSREELENHLNDLQNRMNELQSEHRPPPGWSPVGESVAGPYRPSIDAQLQSSQSAQGDIENRNRWEESQNQQEIEALGNEIADIQNQLQNGYPPSDYHPGDYRYRPYNPYTPYTPPQPTSHSQSTGDTSSGGCSDC